MFGTGSQLATLEELASLFPLSKSHMALSKVKTQVSSNAGNHNTVHAVVTKEWATADPILGGVYPGEKNIVKICLNQKPDLQETNGPDVDN